MGSVRRDLEGKSGFTLLEVLLAVALGAAIVVVATSFIFSMGELWGVGINERLFKKHTRGVSRFLEQSFQYTGSSYSDAPESRPVFWFDWEGDASKRDRFLSFELEKGPGALVWPSGPLPHVVCSLDFDPDEGLFLLWRSRLEEDFDKDPPRRTLVSPFVTEVLYHYIDYGAENPQWEITREPNREADQSYTDPHRIELVFNYKGVKIARQLTLPDGLGGVPLF